MGRKSRAMYIKKTQTRMSGEFVVIRANAGGMNALRPASACCTTPHLNPPEESLLVVNVSGLTSSCRVAHVWKETSGESPDPILRSFPRGLKNSYCQHAYTTQLSVCLCECVLMGNGRVCSPKCFRLMLKNTWALYPNNCPPWVHVCACVLLPGVRVVAGILFTRLYRSDSLQTETVVDIKCSTQTRGTQVLVRVTIRAINTTLRWINGGFGDMGGKVLQRGRLISSHAHSPFVPCVSPQARHAAWS